MNSGVDFGKGSILKETCELLRSRLDNTFDGLFLEKVVIGIFFTGVKLSNGAGGVCYTPIKTIPDAVCCPSSAKAMPDSGRLQGKRASAILDDLFSPNPLKKTIAIAVLNALSDTCRKGDPKNAYRLIIDADPLDYIKILPASYTLVVGALLPYIRMLKKNAFPYGILELDPRTLKEEELPHYVPPEGAADAIVKADYLLVTGTTLINDSLEEILVRRKKGAITVLVGPTASLYPTILFKYGVQSLGGITVTDADGLLEVIGEAGSGYHFFGKFAEKTVIMEKAIGEV